MSIHIFSVFKKKNLKCKKVFFLLYFLVIFLFILTVLIVVCLKIMILGEAMALGTHFVDFKHDQNVSVYHHNRQSSINYQV